MAENILAISLKDYKKQIEELKASLLNLQKGSEAYDKIVREVQQKQEKLNEVMRDTKKGSDAADGSIKQMRQQLSELKKAWVETGDEMERKNLGNQIKQLSDRLNEMHKNVGDYRYNIGNYANSFVEAMGMMGNSMGTTLKTAIATGEGLKKAFSANPYIVAITVAITALVGVFRTLKNAINSNEQTQRKWKEAMATLQPVINLVKNVIDKLAQAFVAMVGRAMEYLPRLVKGVGSFAKAVADRVATTIRVVARIVDAFSAIVTPIARVWERIVSIVADGVNALVQPIASLLDAVGLDDWAEGLKRISATGTDFAKRMASTVVSTIEGAGDAVRGLATGVEQMGNAAEAAMVKFSSAMEQNRALVKAQNDLVDQTRDTQLSIAKNDAEIAKLRDAAAKETDPLKKAELLRKQQELIKDNASKRYDLAKRTLDLETQIASLSPNSVEDNQKLNDLKVQLYNTEAQMYQELIKSDKALTSIEAKENAAGKATKTAANAAKEAAKAQKERGELLKVAVTATEKAAKYTKEQAEMQLKLLEAQGKINKLDAASKRLEIGKKYNEELVKTIAMYKEMSTNEQISAEERKKALEQVAAYEQELIKNNLQLQIDAAKTTMEAINGIYSGMVDIADKSLKRFQDSLKRQTEAVNNPFVRLYGSVDKAIKMINTEIAEGYSSFIKTDTKGIQSYKSYMDSQNPKIAKMFGDVADVYLKGVREYNEIIANENPFTFLLNGLIKRSDESSNISSIMEKELLDPLFKEYQKTLSELLSLEDDFNKLGVNFLEGFDLKENKYDIRKIAEHARILLSKVGEGYTQAEKEAVQTIRKKLGISKKEIEEGATDYIDGVGGIIEKIPDIYDNFIDKWTEVQYKALKQMAGGNGVVSFAYASAQDALKIQKSLKEVMSDDDFNKIFSDFADESNISVSKWVRTIEKNYALIPKEFKSAVDAFLVKYEDTYKAVGDAFSSKSVEGLLLYNLGNFEQSVRTLMNDINKKLQDVGVLDFSFGGNNIDEIIKQIAENYERIPNELKPRLYKVIQQYTDILSKAYPNGSKTIAELKKFNNQLIDDVKDELMVEAQAIADSKKDALNIVKNEVNDFINKALSDETLSPAIIQQRYARLFGGLADSIDTSKLTDELKAEYEELKNLAYDTNNFLEDSLDVNSFMKRLNDFVAELGKYDLGEEVARTLKLTEKFDISEDEGNLEMYFNDILGSLEDMKDKLPDAAKGIVDGLWSEWTKVMNGDVSVFDFQELFKEKVKAIPLAFDKEIEAIKPQLSDEGQKLIKGLVSGMSSIDISNADITQIVSNIGIGDIIEQMKSQLSKAPEYLRPEIENMVSIWTQILEAEQTYIAEKENLATKYEAAQQKIAQIEADGLGTDDNTEYQNALQAKEEFYNEMLNLDSSYAAAQAKLYQDLSKEGENYTKKGITMIKSEKKARQDLVKSTASLMGNIASIMEEDIKERQKQGKITEEEAKKRFETVKAFQISEAVINTISGAIGAFTGTWNDKTIPSVYLRAALAVANAATVTTAGIANIAKIAHTEYGSSSVDGGGFGSSGGSLGNGGTVDPLLNERLDERSMTQLNNMEIENANKEQRVYILQSDISDSEKQVRTRVRQSTF